MCHIADTPQLYSNAIQCMNAVLNISWHDYTVIIFIQVMESWHGIWFTALGNLTVHKSDPWLNLVFKSVNSAGRPNVTASSKTTYSSCSDTLLSHSLSLSLSLSTHTYTHRHDAIFTIGFQSQRQIYYHCQTMHRQVPVSFVCYPQFVIESNHLF